MIRFAIAASLCLAVTAASPQGKKLPPLPPDEWKGTDPLAPTASLVPEDGFDLVVHREMTPAGGVCSDQLNAAMYRQDIAHAFESRAHFDNCAFDEATQYIDSLLGEAGRDFEAASHTTPKAGEVSKDVRAGMFALGQALHAVQDFYAHSNYVELMETANPSLDSQSRIPIVTVWEPSGRAKVLDLRRMHLGSGQVWWSLPHRCSADVPTHHELAKDSRATMAGSRSSPWKAADGQSMIPNYVVARNLAERATRAYLQWCSKRWPAIRQNCGDAVKYIVQEDRRNDPPEGE